MTINNEQLAQKVVEAFKNNISKEALSHLSETEFHELDQIVRQALYEGLSEAAVMVDEVTKQLRNMAGHPDLDL